MAKGVHGTTHRVRLYKGETAIFYLILAGCDTHIVTAAFLYSFYTGFLRTPTKGT